MKSKKGDKVGTYIVFLAPDIGSTFDEETHALQIEHHYSKIQQLNYNTITIYVQHTSDLIAVLV